MQHRSLRIAATIAVLLAFFVVMLGAYTRLTDAGLGCPDWPGCYGRMVLPSETTHLEQAQTSYPNIPIETGKAWTEMAHRYAAGTLALLIFYIGLTVAYKRYRGTKLPWHLPLALMVLVIFQAALGMWTVTLKLLPVVVMGHLLGGMLIVACLSRFRFQISSIAGNELPQWRPWVRLGLLIVFLQVALGGWVSSNYAGIACIGFPQCNGFWFPDLYLTKAFNLFASIGANYQGGLLDSEVRVTIQFIHRLGALFTAVYLLLLSSLMLFRETPKQLKRLALITIALVFIQFTLGVLNVVYLLPLHVAVAHNGVAALLLAQVFCMLHFLRGGQVNAK
ncbi:heme A synthase [Legionella sp. km772]|uniref:COX15/CtaA family protein n=1 Tax=Legionella sp. km772 TaxID=2498111 RepID=UPI000F8F0090|nr:COX15/CtaA family protein [Legionella sp. km772]RUR08361.1 heme A synthase [Legionella sp. km772]